MMLFDADGRIRRFGSPEEIIKAFAPLRLEYYHKRKAHLLQACGWAPWPPVHTYGATRHASCR